jgi:streptogramin lyase
MHRRSIVAFCSVVFAVALSACSSSSTSTTPTPTPIPAQALYAAANTSGGVAEIALPFSAASIVTYSNPAVLTGITIPGIAFDSNGNLYASLDSGIIYVFAHPVSSASTPAATITLPAGTLPVFITLDASNDLWVADGNGTNIYEFVGPFAGNVTPAPAKTLTTGATPLGIAFDAAGNLYAGDQTASTVEIFKAPITNGESPTGTPLTGTSNPRGMAFDSAGNLYVGSLNGQLYRFNSPTAGGGAPSITDPAASTGLSESYFLAMDFSNNLYVSDSLTTNKVYQFTAVSTTFSATSAPAATLTLGSFTKTNGLALGPP